MCFLVQSHAEIKVIEIAAQQAKKSHNMTITEEDAKGIMKDAWFRRMRDMLS